MKSESRYCYTPQLRLAACRGLRLGEVLGLRWEDFDKDESVLRIERQLTRSGEYGPTKMPAAGRRIALPVSIKDELIAASSQLPLARRPPDLWVAEGNATHASERHTPWLLAGSKEAGLEGVTFTSCAMLQLPGSSTGDSTR
jgi:integrase